MTTTGSTSRRESWRQFLHGTVTPLANAVQLELSRKLGTEVRIEFDKFFASDVQGRARSYQSLVTAGMPPAKASAVCGFDNRAAA